MRYTHLLGLIHRYQENYHLRFSMFYQGFSFSIFFLFLGFMCGNLFGTFLPFIRLWIAWDGLIITTLLLIIEGINYISFHCKRVNQVAFRLLNFYKLGILLGFFIDAFKVGS